jgi:hypothetical protein
MKTVYCIFEEKKKIEDKRKQLVMPTKDLLDYLRFRQLCRSAKESKAYEAKLSKLGLG